MGKLTQVWLSDDGIAFDSEEKMLDHENDIRLEKLSKNWGDFLETFISGDDYWVDVTLLSEVSTESLKQAIEYLKLHLESRAK